MGHARHGGSHDAPKPETPIREYQMRRPKHDPRAGRWVSVLCTSHKTPYKHLVNVHVFDRRTDARTYTGGEPVVAHPPCRSWSVYTRHQSTPAKGEKALGVWCAEQVRMNGGILEQPAHSKLWQAACLPMPGRVDDPLSWSMEVCQEWWGCPMIKRTWLYFAGIKPKQVHMPFTLHMIHRNQSTWANLTPHQRSATPTRLAEWLVALARASTRPPTPTTGHPAL